MDCTTELQIKGNPMKSNQEQPKTAPLSEIDSETFADERSSEEFASVGDVTVEVQQRSRKSRPSAVAKQSSLGNRRRSCSWASRRH